MGWAVVSTYETQYAIGQRVRINDLDNQRAVVISIHIGEKGTTYETAWFHAGERKTAYLYPHELTAY
jgi:hypothetical protein